jgi:DNA (cytosine-5)-methyltransferase 1
MEDVSTDDILRPRECVLTNKPYPFQSFRDGPHCSFPASLSKKEIKQQIFHGGRLACRVLNIVIVSKNGKPYSGIIRRLYAKESDTPPSASTPNEPGLSRTSSITVEDDEEDDVVVVSKNKRRARSKSFEIIDPPQRRKVSMPSKPGRYTFGDVFCGAGGSSQGAKQAGLHITWGLDMDEFAICAYHLNHPGAHAFRHNTHEFPPPGWECDELRVDVLHLSPPCCYFSPAQ